MFILVDFHFYSFHHCISKSLTLIKFDFIFKLILRSSEFVLLKWKFSGEYFEFLSIFLFLVNHPTNLFVYKCMYCNWNPFHLHVCMPHALILKLMVYFVCDSNDVYLFCDWYDGRWDLILWRTLQLLCKCPIQLVNAHTKCHHR